MWSHDPILTKCMVSCMWLWPTRVSCNLNVNISTQILNQTSSAILLIARCLMHSWMHRLWFCREEWCLSVPWKEEVAAMWPVEHCQWSVATVLGSVSLQPSSLVHFTTVTVTMDTDTCQQLTTYFQMETFTIMCHSKFVWPECFRRDVRYPFSVYGFGMMMIDDRT